MIDKFFQVAGSYQLPILWSFFLLIVANLIALFIAQVIFPFKLKTKTWEWEKRQKAKEEFIEAVSRIEFIGRDYMESEQANKFSFSGLSLNDTEKELVSILQKIHNEGQKIRAYLPKSEKILFDNFLRASADAYDKAKDTYEQWDKDDYMAEEQHSLSLIEAQAKIASRILKSLI